MLCRQPRTSCSKSSGSPEYLRHWSSACRHHPHSLVTHRKSAFRIRLRSLGRHLPVPASSGGTTRFRLNRGGDRQLNKAIYTIALIRMNRDQATREYVARRTRQGRSKKEIIRSLKRYITRQIYVTSITAMPPLELSGRHPVTPASELFRAPYCSLRQTQG